MIPRTLAEARAQRLDLFFHLDAVRAEKMHHNLTCNGREVVAIIRETLPGAAREHFVVAVKPRPRSVGPQGFPKSD